MYKPIEEMTYQFEVADAIKYGDADMAAILHNLRFWCIKNAANKHNIRECEDGESRAWTYNSALAFTDLFPWLSEDQIDRRLRKLETDGAIESGRFNKLNYDRTKWYAVLDLPPIPQNCGMESAELRDGFRETAEPIPDTKPDTKPDAEARPQSDERTRSEESPPDSESGEASPPSLDTARKAIEHEGLIEGGKLPDLATKIDQDARAARDAVKAFVADCKGRKKPPKLRWLINQWDEWVETGRKQFPPVVVDNGPMTFAEARAMEEKSA